MANVFTGNVLISTSRDAIRKIFFSKSKVSSFTEAIGLLDEVELENSFIVTPRMNTNLLELDYRNNPTDGRVIILKFLETDKLFEMFFLGKSATSILLNQILSAFKQNTESGQEFVDNLVSDQNSPVYKNYENAYIAFGVGDDLRNWAGPMVFTLNQATLNTTADGIKEIELVFNLGDGFLNSNRIELTRSDSARGALNRFSKIARSKDIKLESSVSLPLSEVDGSYEYIFYTLIKKYINLISNNNPNAIIVIPYLNKLARKVISESFDSAYLDYSNLGSPREKLQIASIKAFFKIFGIEVKEDISSSGYKILDGRGYVNADARAELSLPDQDYDPILKFTLSTGKRNNISIYQNLPDPFIPLQNVIDGLAEIIPESVYRYEFTEENNLKLLSLWAEYEFIDDDFESAFLFAPKAYVNSVLYLTAVKDLAGTLSVEDGFRYHFTDYYLDWEYRKKFFEEFIARPANSSFGEDSLRPDELAIQESDLEELEYLQKIGNVPIFRYNVNNPNVLGVTVNYNGAYMSLFNLGIRKGVIQPFINASRQSAFKQILEIIPDKVITKIRNLIKADSVEGDGEIYKYVLKLIKENSRDLSDSNVLLNLNKEKISGTLTVDVLALFITALINYNSIAYKPYIETSEVNAIPTQKELFNELNRTVVNVSIKSVPFFGIEIIGNQCILLAATNSLIGQRSAKNIAPFASNYVIDGVRHVISTSEMYSEFFLRRGMNGDSMSNSEDPFGEELVKSLIEQTEKAKQAEEESLPRAESPLDMAKRALRLKRSGL